MSKFADRASLFLKKNTSMILIYGCVAAAVVVAVLEAKADKQIVVIHFRLK